MRRTTLVAVVSILVLAACGEDDNPAQDPSCGDGIVAGTEECDDGNINDNDQCNNRCEIMTCGDGIVDFDEACDDGNRTNGDGCDNNCTETYCGNGIMSDGEACDDGNPTNGDGCDANCRVTGCGNGAVGGTEECDDGNMVNGDGCDMNCKTSACGNAIPAGTEQCDDGNSVTGDGCSATCRTESAEHEPNEDGTPEADGDELEGNDFAIANPDTNGAFTESVTLLGSLMPAGDEDVFKFTNTGTRPVRLVLDTWNNASGFGIDIACGSSIDTVMNVRNAAGDILAQNNDRDGNIDRCSGLVYPLLAGQTVYVQVSDYQDNAAIASYVLDAEFRAVVCGDGDVGPGEQCDDSNSATGDGCSDTCQIEGAVTEIEPNEDGSVSTGGDSYFGNDFAIANADTNGAYTANTTIVASLMPGGDEDVFKITNTGTAAVNVALDTWDLAHGVNVSCGTTGIDTVLNVRAANGELLGNNDERSTTDSCSSLTYPLLPGRTIYAHVIDYDDDELIPLYALQIRFMPIACGDNQLDVGEQCDDGNATAGDGCDAMCHYEFTCGNGTLQLGEQCDDSNTMAGDGCSATCTIEGAFSEVEPNEDGAPETDGDTLDGNDFATLNAEANGAITANRTIVAAISPAGDEDVFKITNASAAPLDVTLDTWDIALGIGTSCGTSGIDTVITVRDAAGSILAQNDDREVSTDYCAALRYPLAPGATIYAQVIDRSDDGVIDRYALKVAFLPPVCGDNFISAGEQCDDGNTANGDSCSSTCQLEGAVNEIEPNDDGMTSVGPANGIEGNDFAVAAADTNGAFTGNAFIMAAISPAGDEDVFKISNPGTAPALIKLDVWNLDAAHGIGVPCGTSIDTGLVLRDATAATLDSNDDRDGIDDRCSTLTYTLAPGETVYAHVIDYDDNDVIPTYTLQIRYIPAVCGDGQVGPGEQCDDGNTMNGDGCTSTCQAVPEVEPNDDGATSVGPANGIDGNDFATANPDMNESFTSSAAILGALSPAGDEDIFKFTNTGTMSRNVRFDTWEAAAGVGVACENIDTGLVVRDSAGTELDSSDDRVLFSDPCSGLDFTIGAGQSVYVHIVDYDDDDAIASYILSATYQ